MDYSLISAIMGAETLEEIKTQNLKFPESFPNDPREFIRTKQLSCLPNTVELLLYIGRDKKHSLINSDF